MVKRVYNNTVIKWLISSGITGTTLIGGIFLYLAMSGAITINGFSDDSICSGMEDNPCYAYINFTANEDIFIYPTGYDPYGRGTIAFFDPAVKSWKLQRSWGNGWRDIPLDKSCTGTWCGLSNSNDERVFSVAFRKGKDYSIRIIAYKNKPSDVIKWGAFKGDKNEVDPTWFGTKDYNITVLENVTVNYYNVTEKVYVKCTKWYYDYDKCLHTTISKLNKSEYCDNWSKVDYNTTCYNGTKIVEKNNTIITKLGYNIHYYDKDDFNITGECCGYFPEDDKIVCKDMIANICNPICQQTSEDKNVYDEYCDIYDLKQNKIKLTTVGEYGYVEKHNIKLSKIKEKVK